MSISKYIALFLLILFISACSTPEETTENKKENKSEKQEERQKKEETKKEKVIPNKITMLFITQPKCPSCDRLEEVMHLEKPNALIRQYFEIKKVYLGEKIPDNLMPPNGTPTVYFLGSDNEVLVEPIIGEKSETELMEFLDDSFYEFNITYGVDIRQLKAENNETNSSKTNL